MKTQTRWMPRWLGRSLLAMVTLTVLSGALRVPANVAFAQQEAKAALKARFEERRTKLNELKEQGSIGETSRGYVDFVKQPVAEELVNAENADRQTLYEMIAREQNLSVAEVEKRGAKRHFDKASTGHWLKYPNGQWKQKA